MALIVMEVVTSPSGRPSSSISMSSIELIGTPTRPTSPCRGRRVGVVAHLRRQVEGDRQAGLALLEQVAEAAVGLGGVAKPAYWRIVHSRPRYMVGWTPRVNGNSPGVPSAWSACQPSRSSAV